MKRLLFVFLCGVLLVITPVKAEDEKRIVSLVPSGTELIYKLGLLEQLVGVTTVDFYPEELEDLDLMRFDTMMLDVESLLELQPTHIITHEMNVSMTEEILRQVEASTDVEILIIEDEKTIDDIAKSIKDVGVFLDVEDTSQKFAETFLKDIEALGEEVEESQDVIVFVSLEPEIYTVGAETFIDSALEIMGYTNVFHDIEGYKSISIEDILVRNPEYAINITSLDADAFKDALSSKNVKGLQIADTDYQCTIDPDLLARPGIRILEGLEAIEECINN